jgi:hypothetical protein
MRRSKRSRGPLVALLLTLTVWGTVRAADGPRVSSNEARFAFGQDLTFDLAATSAAPIDDVVLHYTVGAEGVQNRRIPEFSPGPSISARHTESIARGQIPPTTEITWWWTVTDSAGGVTETEPQTARYMDERFDWQQTAGDDVVVWWYDAPPDFAEGVQAHAREALADLGQRIGTRPDRPIHIVTYQSREDMLGALIDRGGVFESRLSTLGARVAPDILLLLAGDDNPELEDVIRHELAHIVLHLHLGKDYLEAPAWLDEGLAMYVEGELDGSEAAQLRRAIGNDDLMSLRSLTSFPGQADRVPLAYAESRDVVAWLLGSYGEDSFRELLDRLATGRDSTDEALQAVYGADQLALYQAYRRSHNLAPAATPAPGEAAPRRAGRAGLPASIGLAAFGVGLVCTGLLAALALGLAAWMWRRRSPAGGPVAPG